MKWSLTETMPGKRDDSEIWTHRNLSEDKYSSKKHKKTHKKIYFLKNIKKKRKKPRQEIENNVMFQFIVFILFLFEYFLIIDKFLDSFLYIQ